MACLLRCFFNLGLVILETHLLFEMVLLLCEKIEGHAQHLRALLCQELVELLRAEIAQVLEQLDLHYLELRVLMRLWMLSALLRLLLRRRKLHLDMRGVLALWRRRLMIRL